MRKSIVGFLLVALPTASACTQSDPQRSDYIRVLDRWSYLLRLANEGATSEHIKTPSGGTIKFIFPNKVSSIKQRETEWLAVQKGFQRIALSAPPFRWSDDAAVCDVLALIVLHGVPVESLGHRGVEPIWQLLKRKESIQLEPETTRFLKKHLYLGWDSKTLDDAWIRSYLRRALISLLLGEGKFEEARLWLERFREVGLTKQEEDELSKLIRLSEKFSGANQGIKKQ